VSARAHGAYAARGGRGLTGCAHLIREREVTWRTWGIVTTVPLAGAPNAVPGPI